AFAFRRGTIPATTMAATITRTTTATSTPWLLRGPPAGGVCPPRGAPISGCSVIETSSYLILQRHWRLANLNRFPPPAVILPFHGGDARRRNKLAQRKAARTSGTSHRT